MPSIDFTPEELSTLYLALRARHDSLADSWLAVPIATTESAMDKVLGAMLPHEDRVKAEPLRAIVEVHGGIAEVTECPVGVEIDIIDHDNAESEYEADIRADMDDKLRDQIANGQDIDTTEDEA